MKCCMEVMTLNIVYCKLIREIGHSSCCQNLLLLLLLIAGGTLRRHMSVGMLICYFSRNKTS
jgi:hypothetical protein